MPTTATTSYIALFILICTTIITATIIIPSGSAVKWEDNGGVSGDEGLVVDGSIDGIMLHVRLRNMSVIQVRRDVVHVQSTTKERDELFSIAKKWEEMLLQQPDKRVKLSNDFVLLCKDKTEEGQCVPNLDPSCNVQLTKHSVGVIDEVRICNQSAIDAPRCGPVVSFARLLQPIKLLWSDVQYYQENEEASITPLNFAVLGANGKVGKLVAARLEAAAEHHVRRTTLHGRDNSGQEHDPNLFGVHFGSVSSLLEAFKGVQVAYVMIPIQFEAADVYLLSDHFAKNIARAATYAGVKKVVLFSGLGAQFDPENGGFDTGFAGISYFLEQAFVDFPGDVVKVRAAYLMENFVDFVGHVQDERIFPTLLSPAYKKFDMVSAVDVADEIVRQMVEPITPSQHHGRRRCVEMMGRRVSPHDVAFAFTKRFPLKESTGKETVLSASLPEAEWPNFLQGTASSQNARKLVMDTFRFMNSGKMVGEGEPRCVEVSATDDDDDDDDKDSLSMQQPRLLTIENVVMAF